LKELLEMRSRLQQLMSKMEGNDKLDALLAEVLSNTEKASALAKELGVGGEDKSAEAPKTEETK
jgi:type VI secretion system protein ImpB